MNLIDEIVKLSKDLKNKKTPTLKECLKSRQFICIYSMNFLSICKLQYSSDIIVIGQFFMSTFRDYSAGILKDDNFETLVGSLGGFVSGIRFVWSPLVDKFGYKLTYAFVLVLQIGISVSFEYIVDIKPLFLIWICIIFWCEGAHYTLVPIIIAKHFGVQATMVYAYAFSFGGFS